VIILRRGRILADGTPAEIAAAASTRIGVEVEVDREHIETAMRLAAEVADTAPVAGDDGRLRVDGIARESVPALVARLVEAGASVYRVSPEAPTLERAYVALYGRPDDESGEVAGPGTEPER